MSGQYLQALVGSALGAKLPELDLAVAAACDEPPRVARCVSACCDDLSGRVGGGPAHAVDAGAARLECLVRPIVVLELED